MCKKENVVRLNVEVPWICTAKLKLLCRHYNMDRTSILVYIIDYFLKNCPGAQDAIKEILDERVNS